MTFFVVIVLTVALIIFFGAWAVSADVEDQRSLAFGLPGTTPTLSGQDLNSNDNPYRVSQIGETRDSLSETWWGSAFLKACPLH